jgi:hypothetical protein
MIPRMQRIAGELVFDDGRYCHWGADTLLYVALAATAVSAGVSAYGAAQAGEAQAAAADYNAQVQRAQAQIAQQQAEAQAQTDAQNARRHQGQIAAAYAAAGVDPTQGTPLEVASDQAAQDELTRQTTLYRGNISSLGYQTQATIDQFQGSQAREAGYIGAVGNLLGGVARGSMLLYDAQSSNAKQPSTTKVAAVSW